MAKIDHNDEDEDAMAHVDARRRAWTVEADARRSAESLFETRNVKEIRTIAERTEQDVERKQGELRQLVGRHRRTNGNQDETSDRNEENRDGKTKENGTKQRGT